MRDAPCLRTDAGGMEKSPPACGRCGIYIIPSDDARWAAVIDRQHDEPCAMRLCDEQMYPVEVFYRRIDLNGSTMLDSVVCHDRGEFLSFLNWAGFCRFLITSFWEYNARDYGDSGLWELFEAGFRKRAEIAQEVMMDA